MQCLDFDARIKWFVYLPLVLAKLTNEYIGPELFGESRPVSNPIANVIGNDIYIAKNGKTMCNGVIIGKRARVHFIKDNWILHGNHVINTVTKRNYSLGELGKICVHNGCIYKIENRYVIKINISKHFQTSVVHDTYNVIDMMSIGNCLTFHYADGTSRMHGEPQRCNRRYAYYRWRKAKYVIEAYAIRYKGKCIDFDGYVTEIFGFQGILLIVTRKGNYLVYLDTMTKHLLANTDEFRFSNQLFSVRDNRLFIYR